MVWFFSKKKKVEQLEEEIKDSFAHVKQDFNKVGQWISHLDGKHKEHDSDLEQIKGDLDAIQAELHEIKEFISFFGPKLSKQQQTANIKQTDVEVVQTPVQTAVQTTILSNLSVMERAIVWALVNSEMNLSYEDLAALLGKDRSTIRGQINAIRQKSEGLIEERIESNGKKRLYIPEKTKDFLVKSVKVRVKGQKKGQKIEKNA
jgi:predicted transcriptional regulator